MLSFSANLNFLFNEVEFMDRFKAAAAAGFKNVEFMFPYDFNINEIQSELESNNLNLVLFNLPAGNWAEGDRGIAVDPQRAVEFQDGVAKAIEAADILGVNKINCLMGIAPEDVQAVDIRAILIDNISFAARELNKANISLMIEPINGYDIPGFFMNTTSDVLKLINEINTSNIFLQYDMYHAGREEEDQSHIIQDNIRQIGHVQIADNPGRNEPGSGTLPLKKLLKELDENGYTGFVGLEYKPSQKTELTLGWLNEYGYSL